MNNQIQNILSALSGLRLCAMPEENEIHAAICLALSEAGIPYIHEYRLGPGRRIDFFCGGVGIEVKKGRPVFARLLAQAKRYAESPELTALIIVSQRPCRLPGDIGGKPVYLLSLDRLWGVALP